MNEDEPQEPLKDALANSPQEPTSLGLPQERPSGPPPRDPRRRLRELLEIPDSQRSETEWDELIELEISLAPGNRAVTAPQGDQVRRPERGRRPEQPGRRPEPSASRRPDQIQRTDQTGRPEQPKTGPKTGKRFFKKPKRPPGSPPSI